MLARLRPVRVGPGALIRSISRGGPSVRRKKPPPPVVDQMPWTHMVAFPITDRSLIAQFKEVQTSMVNANHGLARAQINPNRFHLTMARIRVEDEDDLAVTKRLTEAMAHRIATEFPQGVRISFEGVDCEQYRVLYACVEEDAVATRLSTLAQILRTELTDANLIQDDGLEEGVESTQACPLFHVLKNDVPTDFTQAFAVPPDAPLGRRKNMPLTMPRRIMKPWWKKWDWTPFGPTTLTRLDLVNIEESLKEYHRYFKCDVKVRLPTPPVLGDVPTADQQQQTKNEVPE